jgi:hypothetical protein
MTKAIVVCSSCFVLPNLPVEAENYIGRNNVPRLSLVKCFEGKALAIGSDRKKGSVTKIVRVHESISAVP